MVEYNPWESIHNTNGREESNLLRILIVSDMWEPLSELVAAASISAPMEENETRVCFEDSQSTAWYMHAAPTGKNMPDIYPVWPYDPVPVLASEKAR